MHHAIKIQFIMDESSFPSAVQLDYADWLQIERLLEIRKKASKKVNLNSYRGVLSLTEDPLAYQTRIRGEWN